MVPAGAADGMGRGTLALTPAHRVYRLAAGALAPVALLWLWWRGRREPQYARRLGERLGRIDTPPEATGGILIHAASVGEVQAARPLIDALRHEWPDHSLTVSTITPTGMQALQEHWGQVVRHVYLPLDTRAATARFLDRLQPRLLVLMEREIWPELLWQCRQRCIPVVLVNARLSERSARFYRRWASLFSPVWPQLRAVAAADPESQARYIALGVSDQHCTSPGNLKFDMPVVDAVPPRPEALQGRTVIVAGSTHETDEAALLAHWPALHRQYPQLLLVLVPRHPQRFDAVARELAASGLPFVRHSQREQPQASTAIWLGDTMGHLLQWYQHADLCFIGGSLAPIGGHNALEAMVFGKPVIFGPHTHNFAQLYQLIETGAAGMRLASAQALADAVRQACAAPQSFEAMGQRAAALVRQHRGATDRTMALLAPLWSQDSPGALTHIRVRHDGQAQLWHDPALIDSLDAADFDLSRQGHGAQPMATGSGRGQAHVVEHGAVSVVLRHYRRGGLMARISEDRFLGRSAWQGRAMREYRLLRMMRSWQLPVPEPVGARHLQRGASYSADIMVRTLVGTRNLVQRLAVAPLSHQEWTSIGQAIRQLHDRQVFHADLNAHNLLLDAEAKAWIVDFDKCGVQPGNEWKSRNLDRLLRSLRKEHGKGTASHWEESADWPALLQGYAD